MSTEGDVEDPLEGVEDVRGGGAVTLVSEGQRRLLAVAESLADVGQRLEVSRQVVSRWRRGEKKPGPAMRARLSQAYGIPVGSWDARPAMPGEGAAGARGSFSGKAKPSTMEEVEGLLRELRDRLDVGDLMTREFVQVTDAITRALALRARLEREAELLEDRIVKTHPAWKRWRARIADVLVQYPDAARAVAEELAAVEAEGGGG